MNAKSPIQLFGMLKFQRGALFGLMLLGALLAFELFNYSTTEFALRDVLGDLQFAGIHWATILAIAFCGIDFAGLARMFTPEQGADEPTEVWYLFGAWILAAAMNAILTWWGVSVAINQHTPLGTALFGRETINSVVPVFVASMVWIVRILIIGSFSIAGERLFSMAEEKASAHPLQRPAMNQTPIVRPASSTSSMPAAPRNYVRPTPAIAAPSQRPTPNPRAMPSARNELTYHPVNAAPREEEYATRQ
jgi:hypothetical protein